MSFNHFGGEHSVLLTILNAFVCLLFFYIYYFMVLKQVLNFGVFSVTLREDWGAVRVITVQELHRNFLQIGSLTHNL